MKTKNLFMYILGVIITVGFFLLLYFLIFQAMPAENQRLLDVTIGALIGSFTTVVGYFYGSSKGSADKTDIIAKENGNGK